MKGFYVDPAGFAPASLRVKGSVLLHKTTGPDPQNNIKAKPLLLQEEVLPTRRFGL